MRTVIRALLTLACFCPPALSWADVTLPAIVGNHMVLQADKPLPVWGWAEPGEEVTVQLADDSATATADSRGNWSVKLPARKASRTPLEMTVTGKNTIRLTDILVGEVWLGSGQSNMDWAVVASTNGQQEMAAARFPEIRLFFVPRVTSGTPQPRISAQWVVCSPETVPGFSAVLFFFGREIHETLGVPVGLVATSVGGTPIEPWIPPQGFEKIPQLAAELKTVRDANAAYRQARIDYLRSSKSWVETASRLLAEGKEFPDPPPQPVHALNHFGGPTALYNAMVHGLAPFAIRGALWYQGEANVGRGMHYYDLMRGLVQGWRDVWNQGEFPFLFVQLAPFKYGGSPTALPELWEAQNASLKIPNTGMAVTTDITTINDIHPPNKLDVGKRLALWALAKTYGQDVVHSGPLFDSIKVEGDKIRVLFQHAAGGLVARDGKPLTWFAVAGADKKFVPATATIEGETVVVSAPGINQPVAVRFGWNQIAEPNLNNKAGLPASPFRSDTWNDAVNVP